MPRHFKRHCFQVIDVWFGAFDHLHDITMLLAGERHTEDCKYFVCLEFPRICTNLYVFVRGISSTDDCNTYPTKCYTVCQVSSCHYKHFNTL